MEINKLVEKACTIRKDILCAIAAGNSGHPGGSLSCADIMTALYFNEMNIDPSNPAMEGRDKLVLSKGHATPAMYAAMAERGYFPVEELKTLRLMGTRLQGHPSMKKLPGIEMSTGSLGQGISVAVGMAIANKMDKNPGRVYTILGDGELQEGLVWEAAMAASHYGLSNLCAVVDHNGLQIDGRNDDVMTVNPIDEKFKAFGWNVIAIDGHDMTQIVDAFAKARTCTDKPTVIVAETVKGKGVSFMENQAGWHGKAPNADQLKQALEELGGEF